MLWCVHVAFQKVQGMGDFVGVLSKAAAALQLGDFQVDVA
jgi:hypothetical protein